MTNKVATHTFFMSNSFVNKASAQQMILSRCGSARLLLLLP